MSDLLFGVVPDAPTQLVDRMVERSGGVPLYAVEMMRMLLDRNAIAPRPDGTFAMSAEVDDVDIPDSLHGLVGARLDQFDADTRALIADAAILGQSFRIEALLAFRDDDPEDLRRALDGLVRTEVLSLNRDPRSPERGQYRFVQSIIREVAHDRVSRADRLRLHTAVAEFYESLDEPELSGVVASHWLDAVEAAGSGEESEQVRAKASESLLAAAERADLLGSFAQVVVLCLRGVDLADNPADRAQLLGRAARAAHSALDDRARDFAKRAMDEASVAEDPNALIFTAAVHAKLLDDRGETHEAWPRLAEVLEQHPGETPLHATAMAELARSYMLDGQPQALEASEQALEVAERLEMVREVAELWATKGAGLSIKGRIWEAEVILNAALEMAREHQLLSTKRRVMANINYMTDKLLTPFVDEVIEDARRLGDDLLLHDALLTKANNLRITLRWDEEEALQDEIERLTSSQDSRDDFEESQDWKELLRGDVLAAERRIEERWARQGQGDSQIEVNRNMERAAIGVFRGDFREAYERAISVDHRGPQRVHLNWALVAALMLGEREPIEAIAAANADSVRGALKDMRANATLGALAALDGDMAEAEARLEAVGVSSDELWGPIYGGINRLLILKYLGMDHEVSRERALDTHRNWAEVGASNLLELFADLLPPLDESVAETA
jgi:tetratricopeptide (TPR) repeat protein